MIGDKTVLEFFFQFIVIVQPVFWAYLYEWDRGFNEEYKWGFYALSLAAISGIIITGFNVGFYDSILLIQYILLTCLSTYLYNQRWPIKESICLAFLTVFLNSFYWEIVLHGAELLQHGFYLGMLVQFWRLVPLVFFFNKFKFNKDSLNQIVYGIILISVFMFTRWTVFRGLPSMPIFTLTRFCAMIILTKTVIEATPFHKPVDSEPSHGAA